MLDGIVAFAFSVRCQSLLELPPRSLGKATPVFLRIHEKTIASLLSRRAVFLIREAWGEVDLHGFDSADRKIEHHPLVYRVKALITNDNVVDIVGEGSE